MIRAFFRAAEIGTAQAPYNTATLKIYYPAAPESDLERNTGVVPAATASAPFPVVLFLPGINVGPEAYQWLAVALAKKGLVVVTYSWLAEEMPGLISLTPGVDLTAVTPAAYGTKPTCPAIKPILAELARLNETTPDRAAQSPLAGLLDLDTIILGGHSAGGTMALQNANPEWEAHVKGAFSYAAHTMASTFLGYGPGTILPISPALPLLLLGGTNDGVIEASAHRYELENASATLALEDTFHEGIVGGSGDKFLVIIDGANHFSLAHPIDETTGRSFLDRPTSQPDGAIRAELSELISSFIDGFIRGQAPERMAFRQKMGHDNPMVAFSEMK